MCAHTNPCFLKIGHQKSVSNDNAASGMLSMFFVCGFLAFLIKTFFNNTTKAPLLIEQFLE